VRLGAAFGSVAAADLTRNHRRTEGMFGAPVGGVDRIGFEEKGKDRGEFRGEMRRKSACDPSGARMLDECVELVLEVPARDRHTVGGHASLLMAVADAQRVLQDALHARREAAVPMITDQDATPAQQMRETGLMDRLIEPAIRRPAVAHEDAREIGAEQRRGFRKAAPRVNRVDGGFGRRRGPQPLELGVHFPPRLVGRHDRTPADLLTKGRIGRFSPVRRPADRVHESAWRDRQAEALPKQGCDLAEGQPELFVQHDGQRHGGGSELCGRRTDRIGRLERVAPLHAPTTGGAVADGDVKRTHDGAHLGQVLLVLHRVPRGAQASTALRTLRWQRGRMAFVNLRRDRPMGLPAVAGASLSARPAGPPTRGAARERRGLSVQRAPRIIELVFEPVDLLAQPVAFAPIAVPVAFRLFAFASQTLVLTLSPFQFGDQILARGRAPARVHGFVMPRVDRKYKRKLRRSRRSDGDLRATTR